MRYSLSMISVLFHICQHVALVSDTIEYTGCDNNTAMPQLARSNSLSNCICTATLELAVYVWLTACILSGRLGTHVIGQYLIGKGIDILYT